MERPGEVLADRSEIGNPHQFGKDRSHTAVHVKPVTPTGKTGVCPGFWYSGGMRVIQLLGFLIAITFPLHGQSSHSFDLMKLSPSQYAEWGGAMLKESEKDKVAFGASSKKILITMLGLEEKRDVHGLFDIEPNFNRTMLFALVASQNKIALDDSDMENLKKECAYYIREKIKEDNQKAMVMAFYGLVHSQNESTKKVGQ